MTLKGYPIPGEAYRHTRTNVIAICSVANEEHALFWVIDRGDVYISERMEIEECRECLECYRTDNHKRLT